MAILVSIWVSWNPYERWHKFWCIIPNSCRVTRSYFENLVRALENGLSDVNTQAACSTSVGSKNAGGAGKGKGGKGKGSTSRSGRNAARDGDDDDHWNCDRCTYANPDSVSSCQMCHNERWALPTFLAELRAHCIPPSLRATQKELGTEFSHCAHFCPEDIESMRGSKQKCRWSPSSASMSCIVIRRIVYKKPQS